MGYEEAITEDFRNVAKAIYDPWNKAVCEYTDSGMIYEAMNDLIIAGADVDSPANVRVIESTRDSKTYVLKEDRIFPKNTLFRFSRG